MLMIPRPFVKWVGAKKRLTAEITRRIPPTWDRHTHPYYEPFVGGGSLFFDLQPTRAYLSDANHELVDCWQLIKDDVGALLGALAPLEDAYRHDPEATYYDIRKSRPDTLASRCARFVFLNKTSFNGLYRVNRHGVFNAPWNKNPRACVRDEANLRACSSLLQRLNPTIACHDFAAMPEPAPGSLVYYDPPYSPITKTSYFTAFTPDKFRFSDHERLAKHAWKMSRSGSLVVISQSADETVVDLYRENKFRCEVVASPRNINCRGYGRGPVCEYVIDNTRQPLVDVAAPTKRARKKS